MQRARHSTWAPVWAALGLIGWAGTAQAQPDPPPAPQPAPAAQPTPAAQPDPAAAQPAPGTPEATERARTLFEEGVALGDQRQWEPAAAKFREALVLRDAPAIRFNLGAALVELRQWDEAIDNLQRVVDDPEAPEDLRTRSNTALLNARALQEQERQQQAATVPTPEQTAAAAPVQEVPTEDPGGGRGGFLASPWLWGGLAAAVVITVAIVLIASGGGGDRIQGNLDPGLVVVR